LEHIRAIALGCNVPEVVLLRVLEPVPQTYGLSNEWIKDVSEKAMADVNRSLSMLAGMLESDGNTVAK
jgi:hypothetical protein